MRKTPYMIEPLVLLCLLSALPHQHPRIRAHATAITIKKMVALIPQVQQDKINL
jgi:hypothetical protein